MEHKIHIPNVFAIPSMVFGHYPKKFKLPLYVKLETKTHIIHGNYQASLRSGNIKADLLVTILGGMSAYRH